MVTFDGILCNVMHFPHVDFDFVIVLEALTAERAVIRLGMSMDLLFMLVQLVETVEHLPAVFASEANMAILEMPFHPDLIFEGSPANLTDESVGYVALVHVRHQGGEIVELVVAEDARMVFLSQ